MIIILGSSATSLDKKNTGSNGVSRLLIIDEFEENKVYLNIKKHTFKDIFPLDLSYIC